MSYQVLARKWRPQAFADVVGQQHVLQALINALDQQRLHHAYLFTGTRGVGKTTIARLLAKALNCEQAVSAQPCGQCNSCREIEQGNFIDLLEIDAASRTKVEDTRELLDNVQYKPTRGRYKVYLIDEVHMLSRSSFNALLKTLEEPPPHVKFLFATTESQKIPVTILSRCLQFNLKSLLPEQITAQLNKVLTAESVGFDDASLRLLAKAADGSMRDALSLTDQGIAHGNGQLSEAVVSQMLGTLDSAYSYQLLASAAAGQGDNLMGQVEHLSQFAPDYQQVLGDMMQLVHQAAMYQVLPSSARISEQPQQVAELSRMLKPEQLQLFYEILLQGRKELPFGPDPRSGFEMTLLRLLAFMPQAAAELTPSVDESVARPVAEPSAPKSPAPSAVTRAETSQTTQTATPSAPSRPVDSNASTEATVPADTGSDDEELSGLMAQQASLMATAQEQLPVVAHGEPAAMDNTKEARGVGSVQPSPASQMAAETLVPGDVLEQATIATEAEAPASDDADTAETKQPQAQEIHLEPPASVAREQLAAAPETAVSAEAPAARGNKPAASDLPPEYQDFDQQADDDDDIADYMAMTGQGGQIAADEPPSAPSRGKRSPAPGASRLAQAQKVASAEPAATSGGGDLSAFLTARTRLRSKGFVLPGERAKKDPGDKGADPTG